jgi:hypothetical protein
MPAISPTSSISTPLAIASGRLHALSAHRVVVYEIGQAGLAPLLHDRPSIADDLGFLLAGP